MEDKLEFDVAIPDSCAGAGGGGGGGLFRGRGTGLLGLPPSAVILSDDLVRVALGLPALLAGFCFLRDWVPC